MRRPVSPFVLLLAPVLMLAWEAPDLRAQTRDVSQGFQINLIDGAKTTNPPAPDSVLAPGSTETGGMASDSAGNLYFASGDPTTGIGSVYMVTPAGVVTTYATGLGLEPSGLAFDSNGDLSGSSNTGTSNGNGVVYKIVPGGAVSVLSADRGLCGGRNSCLGRASSLDAALLITVPPGSYMTVVAGASGHTGVALVEVYDLP